MVEFRTTTSKLSSAEFCRQAGWGPGTVLWSDPLPKSVCREFVYVEITAVGRESILVRELPYDDEYVLDLHARDWVPRNIVPFSQLELDRMEVL